MFHCYNTRYIIADMNLHAANSLVYLKGNTVKLKKVTSNDSNVRLTVTFKESTLKMVKQYQDYYAATYGDDIGQAQMIEEVVRALISMDKDFAVYVKGLKATAAPDVSKVTSNASER